PTAPPTIYTLSLHDALPISTCDTEMSWFREFEQTYGQNNLVFLNRQVVRGQQDDVTRLFGGLNAIPTTFLIDKSGRIAVTHGGLDRKSTRLNSSHSQISYAV